MGGMEAVMRASERIADEIAGAVLGLSLASLSWLVIGWLWREMGFAAFVIFLVSWVFDTIGITKLRRHKGLVRTSPSGWKSINVSDFGKCGVSLSESIWGDLASILWGVIAGFVVAGLFGKLGLEPRWPVFFVVFLLWAAVVVTGIIATLGDGGEDQDRRS